MTPLTITLTLVAVVCAVLAVASVAGWRRATAHAVRRQESAERHTRELLERLEALEERAAAARVVADQHEYVITQVGLDKLDHRADHPAAPARVSLSGAAFADAVLRESVVHTAAFVHGVRRALAPQTRNRIRFEMRQELKRTRKERKVELRQALREYRARHRADVPADVPAGQSAGQSPVQATIQPAEGAA